MAEHGGTLCDGVGIVSVEMLRFGAAGVANGFRSAVGPSTKESRVYFGALAVRVTAGRYLRHKDTCCGFSNIANYAIFAKAIAR